jgi:hypothetical protein
MVLVLVGLQSTKNPCGVVAAGVLFFIAFDRPDSYCGHHDRLLRQPFLYLKCIEKMLRL